MFNNSNRFTSAKFCLKLFAAIALTGLVNSAVGAQEARISGSRLSAPLVEIGSSDYSLEFGVLATFDPAQIELRRAVRLSDVQGEPVGSFDAATGKLLLPELRLQNARYSAVFEINGDSPVSFALASATLISSEASSNSMRDADGDGIIDSHDAFPFDADSLYLSDGQRVEIDMILSRLSSDQIDEVNGCGYRQGFESIDSFFVRYPDGVLRRNPNGGSYDVARAYRTYRGNQPLANTTVQYWADWLGYSPDLAQLKSSFKSEVWDSQWQLEQDRLEAALALDDEEFCLSVGCYAETDASQLREFYSERLEEIQQQIDDVRMITGGFEVIGPDGSDFIPREVVSDEVGYWTFTRDGQNSIEAGQDFRFSGPIGTGGLNFDGRRLLVPERSADQPANYFGGEVQLFNPALDRDSFSLGLSFRSGAFPTQGGLDPANIGALEEGLVLSNESLLGPRRLLVSAGNYYRWLQVNLNQNCHIELELNYSPLGTSPKKQGLTYVVSEVELDPTTWSDVFLTFNVPDKQISMLLKTPAHPSGRVETFTLPADFEWSFADDWEDAGFNSFASADNNINLFNGSGSNAFAGELDWFYAANGASDPETLQSRVQALEAVSVTERAGTEFSVDGEGYIISALLQPRDYEPWLDGGFASAAVRNEFLRDFYKRFDDDFDFVFIVGSEATTALPYDGMYAAVSNETQGISHPSNENSIFDFTASAGSDGKLQGVVHLPTKWGLENGPSLHEIMHRWGNDSLFSATLEEDGPAPTDYLLPVSGQPHWGFSSVNGQLGGFDLSTLERLGDGLYKAAPFGPIANGGNSVPYSNFELYLMGLIPADEVEDIVVFRGLKATNEEFYEKGQWQASERIDYSVGDIVTLLGPRVPNYRESQKEFKAAVVVLTKEVLSASDQQHFAEQSQYFEEAFAKATGYRATLELGNLQRSTKQE
ncbi:MAG: hypothetical protein O3B02_00025 [Proteobacteria bacterium]|nr:hypothetical protein [Pseudomonadota bacterium]MDA0897135.1 hypothetical protein [Pseudomonadota bacterium]MDA1243368.1 hypothetical protein [Pseudomonadota bacterium]